MKCPRCSAAIKTPSDAAGLFVCPGCGIRLRRTPASKPQPAPAAKVEAGAPAHAVAAESEPLDADKLLEGLEAPASGSATLPPGTPLIPIARPEEAVSARGDVLASILSELKALRRDQERILALLRGRPAASPAGDALRAGAGVPFAESLESAPAALRSRRRKRVLLIDDDEATRRAAIEALERAEVPVRTAPDGNSGLAALAAERPDVIVLELAVEGAMPGKDVINLVKATMEWVDIPIVLFTRLPVADETEARTIHGADELVPKDAPGAAETLAARIVALFRKA